MIVHKCDKCQREIGAWYEIDIGIGAKSPHINVAGMLQHRGKYELCADCFAKVEKEMRYNND